MILYVGEELSKFSSLALTLANPIVRKGSVAQTSRNAIADFHYLIFKDSSEDLLFFIQQIVNDHMFYTQKTT